MSLAKRVIAEIIGTALLLATVIGSGIMGERLSGGNVAIALLANTLATGAVLVALILTFSPISGAHFNPAVTLVEAWLGKMPWRNVPAYLIAQFAGAFSGVFIAHLMFGLPIFFASKHVRAGSAQMFSEFVATFGLLAVIQGCSHRRSEAIPYAVGGYITAAYWFTASTSFANPAVTLARAASDTFAGIRLIDVPGFVIAQLIGAMASVVVFGWLISARQHEANNEALQKDTACCEEVEALQTALATVIHVDSRTRRSRKTLSAGQEIVDILHDRQELI